jgi:hypothetical protein
MDTSQTSWLQHKARAAQRAVPRIGISEATLLVAFVLGLGILDGGDSHFAEPGVPVLKSNPRTDGGKRSADAAKVNTLATAKETWLDGDRGTGPLALAQLATDDRSTAASKNSLQKAHDSEKPVSSMGATATIAGAETMNEKMAHGAADAGAPVVISDTAHIAAGDTIKENPKRGGNDGRPTARDGAGSQVPVAIKPGSQADGGSDSRSSGAAHAAPVSQSAPSVKSASSREKLYLVRTSQARTTKAVQSRAERYDTYKAKREAKSPDIVVSSGDHSMSDRVLSLGLPEAANSEFSIWRGGRGLVGQAIGTSGLVLKGGKEALYSVISAVW